VGDNGQGKTNLIEAIAYLGSLRSVRNARDRDLVRHGAAQFHVRATVAGNAARDLGIGVDRATGRKRILLDNVEVPRQTEALGVLPSVVWSPADVALIAGGPAERRRFLDVMLALSSRAYLTALREYRAALDRRNATIRSVQRTGRGGDAVAAWEGALAERGALVASARYTWVQERAPEFMRLCTAIGETQVAALGYEGDAFAAGADGLRDRLARERDRDIQRGFTSVGPHRDDLAVSLDGHDVRTFGSAGQQRTAAIALRLLEARTLRAQRGRQPVLLLDDPFAELDRGRAARALDVLAADDPGQVVLAVPREEEIPPEFSRLARWRVASGTVTA
jgi:DNA replication and repair protein RecF